MSFLDRLVRPTGQLAPRHQPVPSGLRVDFSDERMSETTKVEELSSSAGGSDATPLPSPPIAPDVDPAAAPPVPHEVVYEIDDFGRVVSKALGVRPLALGQVDNQEVLSTVVMRAEQDQDGSTGRSPLSGPSPRGGSEEDEEEDGDAEGKEEERAEEMIDWHFIVRLNDSRRPASKVGTTGEIDLCVLSSIV